MTGKFRRLFLARLTEVTPADWLLFFQAWAWLLVFDLALRTRPFRSVRALAAGPLGHPTADPDRVIARCLMAVERARHYHLYRMTCLRRSLTLQKLLGTQGVRATLEIGVQKEAGKLLAHAWIEANGQMIGEREPVETGFRKILGQSGSKTDGRA